MHTAHRNIVTLGGFTVKAEPIVQAADAPFPGRLMAYRLIGPRGTTKIISVDHVTGQPDAHELRSLALWVESVNYSTNKIEKRRIDRKVFAGKATRKQVLRGLDLLRKSRALKQEAV
jgi:hypothetical protein